LYESSSSSVAFSGAKTSFRIESEGHQMKTSLCQ